MGTWFVPAQPRTKPGASPIRITFLSMWYRVSWLLTGLAWRTALSCRSQVNHRSRGSEATRYIWFLDRTPSAPQRWEHCWWPVTHLWRVVSLPLPPFGHALLLVSQLAAVYHFLFHHTPNGTFLAVEGTFNAYFRR